MEMRACGWRWRIRGDRRGGGGGGSVDGKWGWGEEKEGETLSRDAQQALSDKAGGGGCSLSLSEGT